VKESPVVKACLQVLQLAGIFAWRNNTGMLVVPARGSFARRCIRYGYPGSADIFAILPGGRFLAVECKKPLGPRGGANGSVQTDEQIAFEKQIKASGGEYVLARSGMELELQLRAWGHWPNERNGAA